MHATYPTMLLLYLMEKWIGKFKLWWWTMGFHNTRELHCNRIRWEVLERMHDAYGSSNDLIYMVRLAITICY